MRLIVSIMVTLLLGLTASYSAFAGGPAPDRTEALLAAAGKVDITPTRAAYLAGYANNRKSGDVHDRLMARCLVLEAGGVRIAFVSCDLIGLPRYEIQRILFHVKRVSPNHCYLAATHTHSGPDTIGMWGPDIQTRGVDEEWMTALRYRIAHLIDTTAEHLEPAQVCFAATKEVPRLSKNIRIPRILDTELAAMKLQSKGSARVIATFVNYACHPEILNTFRITADFPHWLYETVESKTGGVCLYFNGAQGGMITADFDESTTPKGENWPAAEIIGRGLGERTLEILRDAPRITEATIHTQQRRFSVPLENQKYKALIKMKVFPADAAPEGRIETEVNRITLGPAEFLTLPGEVLPNIGLYLKQKMSGQFRFLLGLCCDWNGYILTPEDYVLNLYRYEVSQSIGPEIGPLMEQNLLALMEK